MKAWSKIAAIVMAVVMMLGTVAFGEETKEELVLLTVDGREVFQSNVENVAAALYQQGYAQTDDDFVTAVDYMINICVEEMLIEKQGFNQFAQDELDAFRLEAQNVYENTFKEYRSYFATGEEKTEEDEQALDKKVQDFFASMEYTVEEISEDIQYNAAFDRFLDYLQQENDLKVTEEEVKDTFTKTAEQHKQMYGNNVADYEMFTHYYNSQIWYRPEGYRGVVQILLEADEKLLDDYQSKQVAYEEAMSAEEGETVENPVTAEDVEKARQAIIDSCQETLDEINARLEKGENFVDLIPEYNIDPGMNNPELLKDGYAVHQNSVLWDPAFVSAAFDETMVKPGDVSQPSVGSYGIYLVYYLRDIPGGVVELDEDIYAQIEDNLFNEKLVAMYDNVIKEARSKAEVVYNEENLAAFAGITVQDGVLTLPVQEENTDAE